MKCDNCESDATIHYTQIINDHVSEIHLCEQCAKKNPSLGGSQKFLVSDLLSGLTDTDFKKIDGDGQNLQCHGCGFYFTHFKKTGRFGCAKCYGAFEEQLDKLLKRIHGSKQHLGKSPKKNLEVFERSSQVHKLQNRLQSAIREERYEEAAKLRDEISKLETDNHGSQKDS